MRPTALVTGGGSGIGRAVADLLAHDAWVATLDVQFPAESGGHHAIAADVTKPADVRQAVGQIVAERGGLDWVVSCAGIVRDRVSWKLSDEDWNQVLAVNLSGAFRVVREAVPHVRRSTQGRIVFIGSINGLRGRFGQANYAASKAGLVGLARTMALELARDDVTVNVIAPGFIDTPMTRALPDDVRRRAVARTPLGRTGCTTDIAGAVRFLCSAEAGFITGAVLPVDGGQLLGETA